MATVSKKSWWNEERTKDLLRKSDRAVEAAILVLYDNQTSHEQAEATVSQENGIGFSATEGEFGTSLARQVLERRVSWDQGYTALSQKQLVYARKIALHHWAQFARSLNAERKEKGLPTEAPAAPAKQAEHGRFKWESGDLHPAGASEHPASPQADGGRYDGYQEPLFDEDEKAELFDEGPTPAPPLWGKHKQAVEDQVVDYVLHRGAL